jgi:hypothetical protein
MDPRHRRLYWTALAVQHVGGVIQACLVLHSLQRGTMFGALISTIFLFWIAHKEIRKPPTARKESDEQTHDRR